MIEAILFIIIGFVAMEVSGWAIHKYLMHGVFWQIHKTHHHPRKGAFEKNDAFSAIFGGIAIILMVMG